MNQHKESVNDESTSNENIFSSLMKLISSFKTNNMSFSGLISVLLEKTRNSRKLVLLVVFIALFFDNMLLTTVGEYILF